MSIKEVRRAVSIVLNECHAQIPAEHVALVLLALNQLMLLGDIGEDEGPEAYIERVHQLRAEALERASLTFDERLRRLQQALVDDPPIAP